MGLGLVGVVLLAALAACGDSKSKYRGDGDGGSGGGGSGGAGASGGGSGESPLVPGGTYFRSYDGVDYQDKSFPATVSDFRLDTYEVTVGRFRAFVEAGKGTQLSPPAPGDGMHPKIVNSGWNAGWNGALTENTKALKTALTCENHGTWTDSPGNDEKLPINCVTWYEAFAFCAWDGGRLPTEAEWNYAAAGGAEQRYFPWSSPPSSTTIDPSYAVYGGNDIEPVGSKPNGNGRWGQVDLGGSMSEWTLDGGGDYPLPCNDCASLVYGPYRVFRGGGWGSDASFLRSAYRLGFDASSHGYDAGFRCARTP
ncbi:MAG: SUMF1/EgtB/PvdO family nonheme iron enzyme [Deltaproteobacteria bacterium]|nr:SUMF1/EgtB/PvdO family nonheme iron enzyme [Deltaproteobacteria bacterium]